MDKSKHELIQKCEQIKEGFSLFGTLCVNVAKFASFAKKVLEEEKDDGRLQKDIGCNKEHR